MIVERLFRPRAAQRRDDLTVASQLPTRAPTNHTLHARSTRPARARVRAHTACVTAATKFEALNKMADDGGPRFLALHPLSSSKR